MSCAESQTPALDGTAAQTIFHAETKHLVGRFTIQASHIKPHPYQRPLSNEWVDSLLQKFQDFGIDRAGYPIKVLLESSTDPLPIAELPGQGPSSEVPQLPAGIDVLVYDGQHRVEACRRLEHTSEHWWFAEVYQKG